MTVFGQNVILTSSNVNDYIRGETGCVPQRFRRSPKPRASLSLLFPEWSTAVPRCPMRPRRGCRRPLSGWATSPTCGAGASRRGESRVVLIIVPNVSNPYYAPHHRRDGGPAPRGRLQRHAVHHQCRGGAPGALLGIFEGRQGRQRHSDGAGPGRPHVTGMARHYHLVQCSEYCDNQAVSHVSVDNLAAARRWCSPWPGWATGASAVGADNDFMSTIARRQGYLDRLRVLNPRGRTTRPLPDGITAFPPAWRPPGGCWPGRSAPQPCSASPTCWPWAPCRPPGSWASGCRRTCRWWGLTMWSTP